MVMQRTIRDNEREACFIVSYTLYKNRLQYNMNERTRSLIKQA